MAPKRDESGLGYKTGKQGLILLSEPDPGGLPQGQGADKTYYQCVACHSTQIITQQRITDLRWEELWVWMVESQGMAPPDDDTKQLILAYQRRNFSSQRQALSASAGPVSAAPRLSF